MHERMWWENLKEGGRAVPKFRTDFESPGRRVVSVDGIGMAQDRIGDFIKFGKFLEYL
jgi:hypothetical protein